MTQQKLLFVCMGNICRSPSAEAVMRKAAEHAQMPVLLDSAGTIGHHQGASPDPRSVAAGQRRGYDFSQIMSRKVAPEDYHTFDLILAMDKDNLDYLQQRCPEECQHKLHLLMSFTQGAEQEVPDPYYGGARSFDYVLDLIEQGCDGLLHYLQSRAG